MDKGLGCHESRSNRRSASKSSASGSWLRSIRRTRQLRLSKQIGAHTDANQFGANDLLFAIREMPVRPTLRAKPDPATLGLTNPNEKDRQHQHGR
jgi:hypothetical protein